MLLSCINASPSLFNNDLPTSLMNKSKEIDKFPNVEIAMRGMHSLHILNYLEQFISFLYQFSQNMTRDETSSIFVESISSILFLNYRGRHCKETSIAIEARRRPIISESTF